MGPHVTLHRHSEKTRKRISEGVTRAAQKKKEDQSPEGEATTPEEEAPPATPAKEVVVPVVVLEDEDMPTTKSSLVAARGFSPTTSESIEVNNASTESAQPGQKRESKASSKKAATEKKVLNPFSAPAILNPWIPSQFSQIISQSCLFSILPSRGPPERRALLTALASPPPSKPSGKIRTIASV